MTCITFEKNGFHQPQFLAIISPLLLLVQNYLQSFFGGAV